MAFVDPTTKTSASANHHPQDIMSSLLCGLKPTLLQCVGVETSTSDTTAVPRASTAGVQGTATGGEAGNSTAVSSSAVVDINSQCMLRAAYLDQVLQTCFEGVSLHGLHEVHMHQ